MENFLVLTIKNRLFYLWDAMGLFVLLTFPPLLFVFDFLDII